MDQAGQATEELHQVPVDVHSCLLVRLVHCGARVSPARPPTPTAGGRIGWMDPVGAPVSCGDDARLHHRLLGGEEVGHTGHRAAARSEEHTSELQSLMRISYAVF